MSALTLRPLAMSAPDYRIDLLALHAARPQRYPFLLESVAHGTPQGRYDILLAYPGEQLRLDAPGGGLALTPAGIACEQDFAATLSRWWQTEAETTAAGVDHRVPFRGGWFVFLAYEWAAEVEPGLCLPAAPAALPVAYAVRCPAAVVVDHQRRLTYLVSEQASLLDGLEADVEALLMSTPGPDRDDDIDPSWVTHVTEQDADIFARGVERIKRYIVEGDVFQVNLSRLWEIAVQAPMSAVRVYRRLRRSNPGPFAGLARVGDSYIISSSPERLVQVQGRVVQTRPIAGTRPRGTGARGDRAESEELLAHPKERAEHVMLIDLERNDLGRVCVPGSIEVDELMALESYATVHHIVSNVRGELRAGVGPVDVLRAVFPGGTITGCPKVRCMEIIAELEGVGRGAYTGSMGYLNRDGDLDMNILIRSFVHDGTTLSLRTGAGIVADSSAARELAETRHKALGLLRALGLDAAG